MQFDILSGADKRVHNSPLRNQGSEYANIATYPSSPSPLFVFFGFLSLHILYWY